MKAVNVVDVDIEEVIVKVKERVKDFDESHIYILPENFGSDSEGDCLDQLNEFAPDMMKLLNQKGATCRLVHSSDYKYMANRSADVILPTILNLAVYPITMSIIANFLTDYIKNKIDSTKTLKVKVVTKTKQGYKSIELEGTNKDVLAFLEKMEDTL